MVAPLIGILGLLSGALGQDAYYGRQREQSQGRIRGLMGSAPGDTGFQGEGPPSPGTGLLADPSNIKNQLEFMAGVMGLPGRDRAAAGTLFDSIMGRASSERATREGRAWSAEQNAIAEANIDRRWQAGEAAVTARFDQSHDLAMQRFDADKAQFGEQAAFEKFKFNLQNARAEAEEKRQELAARRDAERHEWERVKFGERKAPDQVKLQPGYRAVMVQGPGGPQVIAAPVEGTKDWIDAQEASDALTIARLNIAEYRKSVQKHGSELYGAEAGNQTQLRGRVMESMGQLAKLGVLNVGDVERLSAEIPDSAGVGGMFTSNARFDAQLSGLAKQFEMRHEQLRARTRGWGIRMPDASAAPGGGGRDKPPAGSRPLGASSGAGGSY